MRVRLEIEAFEDQEVEDFEDDYIDQELEED
jgi:hypothetical protein